MALRFCHRCACEVEDAGGFCLLGHPLRLEPPIPSVSHIRDEVTRAFDEARIEASDAEAGDDPGREPGDMPARVLRVEPSAPDPDPLDTSVPPPPPLGTQSRGTVWEALASEEPPDGSDPIAAFAPAARMDWGPERSGVIPLVRRREDPATA
jgi:hypothetical protein